MPWSAAIIELLAERCNAALQFQYALLLQNHQHQIDCCWHGHFYLQRCIAIAKNDTKQYYSAQLIHFSLFACVFLDLASRCVPLGQTTVVLLPFNEACFAVFCDSWQSRWRLAHTQTAASRHALFRAMPSQQSTIMIGKVIIGWLPQKAIRDPKHTHNNSKKTRVKARAFFVSLCA